MLNFEVNHKHIQSQWRHIPKHKLTLIKTLSSSAEWIDNYTILHCLDSRQLTLDVNTVHPSLHLSEGNRAATMKSDPKNYPDHPDRFEHWQQVRVKCLRRRGGGKFCEHSSAKMINEVINEGASVVLFFAHS